MYTRRVRTHVTHWASALWCLINSICMGLWYRRMFLLRIMLQLFKGFNCLLSINSHIIEKQVWISPSQTNNINHNLRSSPRSRFEKVCVLKVWSTHSMFPKHTEIKEQRQSSNSQLQVLRVQVCNLLLQLYLLCWTLDQLFAMYFKFQCRELV